jgi:hypothetical protein
MVGPLGGGSLQRRYTSMLLAGFEYTIPVIEWVRLFPALFPTITAIGRSSQPYTRQYLWCVELSVKVISSCCLLTIKSKNVNRWKM